MCEFEWMYRLGLLLVVHLSVASFTVNVLVALAVARASLIDNNVKWLLGNVNLTACIIALHTGIRSLIRLLQSCLPDETDMVAALPFASVHARTYVDCALEELIFTMAFLCMILSISFIGSERLSATVKKEYSESNGCAGYILCTVGWFVSSAIALSFMVVSIRSTDREAAVAFCFHGFLGTSEHTLAFVLILVIYPCVTVGIYAYLYRRTSTTMYQFGINLAAPLDLAARFQIRCNLDMTKMMLPSVCVQAMCTALLLPVLYVTLKHISATMQAIGVNVLYLVLLAQHIVHCFILVYMSRSIRRGFLTICNRNPHAMQQYEHHHSMNDIYPIVNFRRSPEDYHDVVATLWNSIDQEQDSV